jgi:hypothetical protein
MLGTKGYVNHLAAAAAGVLAGFFWRGEFMQGRRVMKFLIRNA